MGEELGEELGEDRQRGMRKEGGQTEEGEEGQVRSSDGMPRKTVSRHMGHL